MVKSMMEPGDTKFDINLSRECFQAGSSLTGVITLVPGSDFGQLIEDYKAGLLIEVSLFGSEKVYWASGFQHSRHSSYEKNLVPGDKRRSKANILIDFKQ